MVVDRVCKVSRCQKPHHSNGFCWNCQRRYKRLMDKGLPVRVARNLLEQRTSTGITEVGAIAFIIDLKQKKYTRKQWAEALGCTRQNLDAIASGKTYRDLPRSQRKLLRYLKKKKYPKEALEAVEKRVRPYVRRVP